MKDTDPDINMKKHSGKMCARHLYYKTVVFNVGENTKESKLSSQKLLQDKQMPHERYRTQLKKNYL